MEARFLKFQIFKKYRVLYFIIFIAVISFFYFNISQKSNQLRYWQYISVLEESSEGVDEISLYESQMASALKNNEFEVFLMSRISMNEYLIENGYANDSLQNEINFDYYLLDHHLKPLNLMISFNHIGEINGASAIYMMIKEILPLILPILTLFVTMRSIDDDQRVSNYIMTLPLKKTFIRKTQWLSSFLVVGFCVCLLLLISFVIGVIFGGIGSFLYPITLNTSMLSQINNSFYFPLWLFIICALIYLLIQIICYSGIGFVISYSIKNTWLKYMLGFVLGILPIVYILVAQIPLYVNTDVMLIPFVCDGAFYVITQGYSLLSLFLFFLFIFLIIGFVYYFYIKKLVNEYE